VSRLSLLKIVSTTVLPTGIERKISQYSVNLGCWLCRKVCTHFWSLETMTLLVPQQHFGTQRIYYIIHYHHQFWVNMFPQFSLINQMILQIPSNSEHQSLFMSENLKSNNISKNYRFFMKPGSTFLERKDFGLTDSVSLKIYWLWNQESYLYSWPAINPVDYIFLCPLN
jgi:hypothetical protein